MPLIDCAAWPRERVRVDVGRNALALERTSDMETLWEAMGDDRTAENQSTPTQEFGADERLPYWAEIWPSSLLLARHLDRHASRICKRRCLDLGCGLGLTALAGAKAGARVLGMDYEWPALYFARRSQKLNAPFSGAVRWVLADWRAPGFKPGIFECIWGADVMYERRFMAPVANFLAEHLAPGGVAWFAAPERKMIAPFAEHVRDLGFSPRKAASETVERVAAEGPAVKINVWEFSRTP